MTGAGAVIASEAKQSQPANVVAEIAWALSAPRNDQKSRRPRNPVRADLQKSLPECLPAHVVEFLPSNAKRETGEDAMRSFTWLSIGVVAALLLLSTNDAAPAATISGTVTGPDSAPFRGAFVQARNAKTHITVSVLSDPQGKYRIDNLPAGDYRLGIRAPG